MMTLRQFVGGCLLGVALTAVAILSLIAVGVDPSAGACMMTGAAFGMLGMAVASR